MPHRLPSLGSPPSSSSRCANTRNRRKAEIVDSLVFMIAGLLLPAWLLGHLFLTFYPASSTSEGVVDNDAASLTSVASSSQSETGSSIPKAIGLEKNNTISLSNKPTTDAENKFNSLSLKFDSLAQTATDLKSRLASAETENATLRTEIASVKSNAPEMRNEKNEQPSLDGDSAVVEELRKQLGMTSEKLTTTKESLTRIESRLRTTETERQSLQSQLTATMSKLELAEVNLATAKQRADEMATPTDSGSGSPFAEIPSEDDKDVNLLAEANQKIAELQQNIRTLSQSVETTNDALARQKAELNNANLEVNSLGEQNNDLKTKLLALSQKSQQDTLPQEVYRDFISSKGSVSKMAFIRWDDDEVIVRSFDNKKLYRLTLDRFSDTDQQYLLQKK